MYFSKEEFYHNNHCIFRETPVPRTGIRFRGTYFRHPATTNERRSNEAFKDIKNSFFTEEKIPISGRLRDLPSAWDDIPKSSREDRSWKKFRKHQYKGN